MVHSTTSGVSPLLSHGSPKSLAAMAGQPGNFIWRSEEMNEEPTTGGMRGFGRGSTDQSKCTDLAVQPAPPVGTDVASAVA